MNIHPVKNTERGSVLWFILIALVLIGLLTALLSRSGTSVNQSGDVEQQRIKINQMLRYVKGMEAAIQQMKLRGISESDLDFSHGVDTTPADGTDDHSNSTCTSNECRVFHVDGGGITHQPPPTGISSNNNFEISGRLNVNNVGTDGIGTGTDLIILLQDVSLSYCLQINKVLGIDNPGGMPPKDAANSNPIPFFYLTTARFIAGNLINGPLDGLATACYDGFDGGSTPPEGTYQFYHVILAR